MKKYIEDYISTIAEWKHCPMANYVCPVHRATFLESLSPRGLALIISNFENSSEYEKKMIAFRAFQCMMCRLCQNKSRDETSIPDAVAAFRADMWKANLVPKKVRDSLKDLKTIADEIEEFRKQGFGLRNDKVLLVDPVTLNLAGRKLSVVAEKLDVAVIVLPASLIQLYNYGLWNHLNMLLVCLEELFKQTMIIVESSLDSYIVSRIISLNIRTLAEYIRDIGIKFSTIEDKVFCVLNDVPDGDPRCPQTPLYEIGSSSGGKYWVYTLHENIPIVPKEFPAYRDTLHAALFPDIASGIVKDILKYVHVYDIEVFLTETPETAEVLTRFGRSIDGVKFFDLISLLATEG